MKNFVQQFKHIAMASLAVAALASCSDVLDEQPRSIYEPGFFKTEKGIDGGLTALYAHLRNVYGNGYYWNACESSTDEYTYGQSADGNFKDGDLTIGVGELKSTTCRADVLWGSAFTYINTASGIIENATQAGIAPAKVAEAHFFRGFDYFNLVRTFGGVPLDFGSGEMKFNQTPSRTSVRNTVPEVYTKAVFPELKKAVENLPDEPRQTGTVTKTVARKFLSEAYLTYAWWLENPKNIPTYPACDRVDPDGHDAHWYFQAAYDLAVEAIDNPGPYKLMDTYYDLFRYTNDRNAEMLLWADYTPDDSKFNGMTESGASWGYASGGSPDNFVGWMANWNYANVQMTGVYFDEAKGREGRKTINPIGREAIQPLGRPWTRMAPTVGGLKKFEDADKDSRFDGTFTSVYHANWHYSDAAVTEVIGANNSRIPQGGVVMRFLAADPATPVAYSSKAKENLNFAFGTHPDYNEYVVAPSNVSRLRYPAMYKQGMYPLETTSPDGKPQLGSPNGPIARPFTIARFAEFYLLAAEAAVKGASGKYSARDLVNVLRARAGKWTHKVNGDNQYWEDIPDADYSAELTAKTPAVITIDYILDERLREFYGEGKRWFDLTRTQTWKERAGTYEIAGSGSSDFTPEVNTRNIPDAFYLRPIPQGTLDAFEMTDAEKDAYQNPGYGK